MFPRPWRQDRRGRVIKIHINQSLYKPKLAIEKKLAKVGAPFVNFSFLFFNNNKIVKRKLWQLLKIWCVQIYRANNLIRFDAAKQVVFYGWTHLNKINLFWMTRGLKWTLNTDNRRQKLCFMGVKKWECQKPTKNK